MCERNTECPRNNEINIEGEVGDITGIQICIATHCRKRVPGIVVTKKTQER